MSCFCVHIGVRIGKSWAKHLQPDVRIVVVFFAVLMAPDLGGICGCFVPSRQAGLVIAAEWDAKSSAAM